MINLTGMIPKVLFAALLLSIGLIAGIGITAVANHDGDSNTIHGCVAKNGSLQVLGEGETCKNSETSIEWNVQGPTGPPGPPGSGGPGSLICINCIYGNDDEFGSLAGDWFVGRSLPGSQFPFTQFTGINLTDTDFSGSDFTGTLLHYANFSGSTLTNVIFHEASFNNTNLTNADLTGSDFSDVNSFNGVIWLNTTCPDGTNSDDNGNTCLGHLVP